MISCVGWKVVKGALFGLAVWASMPVPRSSAQAVPLPIADAPLAGQGASPYCSTNIPVYYKSPTTVVSGTTVTTAGESEGDGCPAANTVNSGMVGVAVDSYGNVFFADNGHRAIRVIYEGGAAVAQAIVNAQPTPTTLTTSNLQKGYVYLIVGSYTLEAGTTTVVAPLSPFNCNQAGTGALANPNSAALAGCPGGYAAINPKGIAVDADGNVFFTTISGSGIEVLYVGGAKAQALILAAYSGGSAGTTKLTTVTPGYVYRLGGTTGSGYSADGLPGISTLEDNPVGMFIDANENVIYADEQNNLVRKINGTTGIVTTVAGACKGGTSSVGCESAYTLGLAPGAGDGGSALSANFNYPFAVVEDSYGNLFIADSGINEPGVVSGRVRVVYAGGTLPGIGSPVPGDIYTYAGGGTAAITNTQARSILFDEVEGLSIDASGYLYVTDHKSSLTTSNRVWRIDPVTGVATVLVGTGGGALATSTLPATLACGATPGPVHSDKYGSGCPGPQAYLLGPAGNYAFDKFGNGYLADASNNLIREFSTNTIFPSTAVGSSSAAQYLTFDIPMGTTTTGLALGVEGSNDAEFLDIGTTTDSCATAKNFTTDTICSFDVNFTPTAPGTRLGSIQVNTATGTIGTQFLSGTGTAAALTIDPGTVTALGSGITPSGVAVDELGNAYLVDSKGKQVLKIPAGGGTSIAVVTGLGTPTQAAIDGQGTIYVADTGNNWIVRTTTAGVTTYLGTGLNKPSGVAVDVAGNVYVADTGNSRVLEIGAVTGIQSILNIDIATLMSPSSLTVDLAGNLYIVDIGSNKVIELPITGGQQVVSLPTGLTPVAIAVDLAGDYFIGDSSSLSIVEVPLNATTGTPSLTALTSPVGLAIDSSGNLYVADSANTSIMEVNRLVGALVFPQTDIKVTNFPTLPLTLTSSGNLNATLGTPLFTNTNTAMFPVSAPSTGACTAGALLSVGSFCQETATFHPTATGNLSAVLTFPSNGNSVMANLSGDAVNLTLTSVSVLQTAPTTAVIYVGQSATFSATVLPTALGVQPTGTMSITVDGGKAVVQTLPSSGSPAVSLSLTPALGVHVVKACYSGDSVYVASCGTANISVVLNPTSTSLTEVAALVNGSAAGVTLTAMISSKTNTSAITGTVTFTNGTGGGVISLGSATVIGGVATLTTPTGAANSNSYTACFNAGNVFDASCTTVTGAPDFVILPMVFPATTPATTSLGIPQGGQSLATITVVPLNGYVGTLTGSCSNLTQNSSCRFTVPAASIVAPAAGSSQVSSTVSFQVFTDVNQNTAMLPPSRSRVFRATFFGWPVACTLMLLMPRRRSARAFRSMLVVVALVLAAGGFSGCESNTNTASYVTPAGATTITVTLTDANSFSHSVALPINVASQ